VFAPNNGRLWRLDGAAAYLRAGVVVDLHWGLHAGLVPARTLRPLAHAMWESASPVTAGLWQPDPETLAAYLIIHTAHQLGRDDKRALLQSVLSVASPEVVHRHLESVGFADLDGPVRGACRGEQPFPKLDPLVVRFAPASRRLIRAARNRLPALIRRQWRARLLPGRGPRRWSR
jgi:hypothetical protein